jgi:hypothetical protein
MFTMAQAESAFAPLLLGSFRLTIPAMTNQPAQPMPNRDRLSVLTAIILLAYALTRLLDLPTRVYETRFLGSQLGLELNGTLLIMLLVAALISAGSDSLFRGHPHYASRPGAPTVLHWIVPGATALVLGAVLNRAPDGPLWWIGLGLSALVLIAVLVAEYTAIDREDPRWQWAALGLTVLSYGLVLIVFALLRSVSARALVGSSVGGIAAALLALRLYVLRSAPLRQAVLYCLIVATITAQVLWALSYWRVSPGSAGLMAMMPFYLVVGLAQQHLAGRLTRRIWIEYGAVGGIGLTIALFYALA